MCVTAGGVAAGGGVAPETVGRPREGEQPCSSRVFLVLPRKHPGC